MLSSSLFLSVGTVLTAFSSTAFATKYKVQDTYQGKSFLNGFDFFTAADPTNGFVEYLDQPAATEKDMLKRIGNDNYIGVDHKSSLLVSNSIGRSSVRIESKQSYTQGLFVVDLKHMPAGACGTWPAFWSLGSGAWPTNGEIDIIEGVNQNSVNKMVLHTDTDCKVDGKHQTGAQALYDCALDSASGASGCDVNAVEPNTYGTGFNSNDGGVYAMEWTEDFIKMWFFPRGNIPASITADKPDTSTFGTPNANFQGACDIDKKFVDHRFIFDTTFCGDWAGNVYGQSGCPAYTGLSGYDSCKKFVAENPSAFEDTFWQISYFKTYKKTVDTTSSSLSSSSSISSTKSSSSISSTKTSSSISSTKTSSTMSSTKTSTSMSSSSTKVSSSSSTSSHLSATSSMDSSSSSKTSPSSSISGIPYPSGNSSTIAFPTGASYPIYSDSDSYPDTTRAVYEPYSSSVADYGDYESSSADSYDSGSSTATEEYDSYPTTVLPNSESGYEGSSTETPHTTSTSAIYGDYESATATYGDHDAYETSASGYGYYKSSSAVYEAYGSSTPSYGDPKSSSAPYGSYESSAPSYGGYENTQSVYDGYATTGSAYPSKSSGSYSSGGDPYMTTTYTTSYVDVCETGYTTVSTVYTAVYEKPTSVPSYEDKSASKEVCPPGFTTTAKYCATGCGDTPTTVTLTVPIMVTHTEEAYPTGSDSAEEYPTEAEETYATDSRSIKEVYPTGSSKEAYPTGSSDGALPTSSDSSYEHYTEESYPASSTTLPSVYVTKVMTLSVIPVPASEYYAVSSASDSSSSSPSDSHVSEGSGSHASAAPEHSTPQSTPGVHYTLANMTFSYGTGTGSHGASKTEHDVPYFTGAASRVRVSGVVGGVVVAVAAMML